MKPQVMTRLMRLLQPYWVPLFIAQFCVITQLFDHFFVESLRFSRSAVLAGEGWRLVSANFVHGSWTHLAMNLAALALVAILFGRELDHRRWMICVAISSLGVGMGILWWQPDVVYYVGFSGVLHGLFIAGGITHSRHDALAGWGFVAVIAAKLAWELWSGPLPGSEQLAGGPVLIQAHLYGALFSLPLGLYWRHGHHPPRRRAPGDGI